jgi:tetratricopeptide (TPR) repeat protein
MIPTETEWTVILSRDAARWGSFGYDPANDAARFTVSPAPAPTTESLQYSFDRVEDDSADLVLAWGELRVALPIEVDTKAETIAALRRDLTGLAQFFWQPWNTAANWAIDHGVALDEASAWIERSIGINDNFLNNKTKAKLLRARGDAAGADALLARALGGATEQEVNQYGYELLGENRRAEAIAIFRKNVKDHPRSWNCYDSLGEALLGDPQTAAEGVAMYRKALAMAPAAQKQRIEGILARQAAKG